MVLAQSQAQSEFFQEVRHRPETDKSEKLEDHKLSNVMVTVDYPVTDSGMLSMMLPMIRTS